MTADLVCLDDISTTNLPVIYCVLTTDRLPIDYLSTADLLHIYFVYIIYLRRN